jgi:hypothetical protein
MIRRVLVVAAALLGAAGLALAQSQELVVAVYVPGSVVASAQARSEYAQSLANQLGQKVGRPARGVAFARARDLETAVQRREIHAAVLDPVYLAGRAAAKVLATATSGGGSSVAAIGVSRIKGGLSAHRGKKLIVPSAGGAEARFVEGFVLEGQATSAEFWSAVSTAPDAASAIAAVAGEQADVALVLDSSGARSLAQQRGLAVAFTTRSLPGPAFAWVGAADPALESAVGAAVRGLSAGPAGGAWGAAADGYRGLLGRPAMPRPLFGAPTQIPFRASNAVDAPASDMTLPPWTPVWLESPAHLPP